MLELQQINDDWVELNNAKSDFLIGNDQILLDDFRNLVKQTYNIILEVHNCLSESDFDGLSKEDMCDYFNLISLISAYGAPCFFNESNGTDFIATRLIAQTLADYASNISLYKDDEEELFEEYILTSFDGFDIGLDKEIKYDVESGDISDFVELAEKLRY